MSGAASLGNLLNVTADLNYYTMKLNEISAQYEAVHQKMTKQEGYEEKYIDAYEDGLDDDKSISFRSWHKAPGETFTEEQADGYAHDKVSLYDEELSLELAELDIEYDSVKTMYEALVTEKQTEKDSCKQATSTQLQDNHQLQS